jgi:hydroxylamine dehydrogenase
LAANSGRDGRRRKKLLTKKRNVWIVLSARCAVKAVAVSVKKVLMLAALLNFGQVSVMVSILSGRRKSRCKNFEANEGVLTMKKPILIALPIVFLFARLGMGANALISDDTQACIDCHASLHPNIISSWKKSLHSKVTPAQGLEKGTLKRRVSIIKPLETIANNVVGCAECHTMNREKHKDTFEHNGYDIHIVVTPRDCATCHPAEVGQYEKNLMSQAYGNLQNNPVFRSLADSANGIQSFKDMKVSYKAPDDHTNADSCLFCHGTVIDIKGTETRETVVGEMEFPILSGWPNQGVGRINPDGSKGSCTACHARHRFSIEMARKPNTCSECHKGPDVPAYGVYSVSKHGNIYSALGGQWNFDSVPWTVGKDFSAPTCATCHVSLLVSEDGEILAQRTHQINDRIPWRIFGLIYAHPHPKSPDTTIIKNGAGLSLPTELTGEPATGYLIDEKEQIERKKSMQKVCLSCHSRGWVEGHFARFENTLKITNEMTLTATKVLLSAWEKGLAKGLAQKDSIFNESIEKKWVEQWLFYANSTRFASAMAGADYGAFANGRWYMSKNIQEMLDWLKIGMKTNE